ncbi:ATP-binding protein [Dokdonella sp. MW10]|uniref:ATP-binding protein n=1 Tax=Dokdonella sp. MW10 TaxID=2992926 RepID=UPI003F7F163C
MSCIAALVVIATGAFAWHAVTGDEVLQIRPATALLALLVALAFAFRLRPQRRHGAVVCGAIVALACGTQLVTFIVSGSASPWDASNTTPITQNVAAGLFCIGAALVLDGLLPAQWGRHMLLGLSGAIGAALGLFGAFALSGDLPEHLSASMTGTMRLPSALVLVFAGLGLIASVRLRSRVDAAKDARGRPLEPVRDRTGLVVASAVLVLSLGTTALLWRVTVDEAIANVESQAASAVDRFAGAVAANAQSPIALIDGLVGLFQASDHVEPDEWSRYLGSVNLRERFVGVIAAGHATSSLPVSTDAAGVRSVSVDGKAVMVWPDSPAEETIPIIYVSPDDSVVRQAIGYNIAADPDHLSTIRLARASGHARVSPRIDFTRFHDPRQRVGFVVIAPVQSGYGGNGDRGFVYASVDVARVVARSLADVGQPDLALRIVDDAATADAPPLFEDADFDASGTVSSQPVELPGRTWTVHGELRPAAVAAATSGLSSKVLAGGLLASLVLFAITWILAGHRARAMHLASLMTAELRRSERAQQAITETANAGIITADSKGRVLYMNPAAALMFGVDAARMAGESLTRLMPERFRDAHQYGLERVLAGGPAHVIGHAVELSGLRGDGGEFPLEILLSAWRSDDETFFTAFLRDITQRKTAEAVLVQKTRELERSNADLEQFAYVASHDLQEPLRMVASYVQLLSRRYRGRLDADADDFIAYAVDGATRMQRLIQDLLAYARVGRSGASPVPTNIARTAQAATDALQEAVAETGAIVEIDADCEALAIPAQLTQVMQNLIGNALKFRGEASPVIRVTASCDGASCRVAVADNGIGILPQHRERVFAIFQRLHTRTQYPGTGIGLAICRKIIESNDGTIWVESDEGAGSTFHFTLPAVQDLT